LGLFDIYYLLVLRRLNFIHMNIYCIYCRHLDFCKLCFCDVDDVFYIEVATIPPELAMIGQIVKTWQQFFEMQYSTSRHLELWSLLHYLRQICVPFVSLNISTEFGDDLSNNEGMETVLWNPRCPQSPFLLHAGTMHFRRHRCAINRSHKHSTKCGDDRSNSKEMSTVFRYPRWRQPLSWKVLDITC